MKEVFADTHYWIAIINPGDQWAEFARAARSKLGQVRIVTTDEVLTEFVTALAPYGPQLREAAVKVVRAILNNPNVSVVPQTRQSFLDGVALYDSRKDKRYSLTDCISMTTMKTRGITEVLSNDHHFEQEGFIVLIKKEQS